MAENPLCRHGDGLLAVARFAMSEGCVCFPDDREQDLCAQHIVKWGIVGESSVTQIYIPQLAERLGIETQNSD